MCIKKKTFHRKAFCTTPGLLPLAHVCGSYDRKVARKCEIEQPGDGFGWCRGKTKERNSSTFHDLLCNVFSIPPWIITFENCVCDCWVERLEKEDSNKYNFLEKLLFPWQMLFFLSCLSDSQKEERCLRDKNSCLVNNLLNVWLWLWESINGKSPIHHC